MSNQDQKAIFITGSSSGLGLLGVHSVSISNISTATVKRDAINDV